jgi:deoxycytidine triphosphate deaminase
VGTKTLLQLVREQNLVDNLCERELTHPEGAGFDLRVGQVWEMQPDSVVLGVEKRSTPKLTLVADITMGNESYCIQPEQYVLVTTMETVNMPDYLAAHVLPRTTTFRSGLMLRTGPVHPGYKGTLTFGLKNDGPAFIVLEMGARIAHIQFHSILGESESYRGQWQGGRVSTDGITETQV